MTPDEWSQSVQNEVEHVQDREWAAEARRYARWQNWKANLSGFGRGLFLVQLGVLTIQTRGILVLKTTIWAIPRGMFWLNLTEALVIVAALLGRRGARPWPVALAFALNLVALSWTDAATRLFSPGLSIGWAFQGLGAGRLMTMTILQVALAYFAVALGHLSTRPRRLA